MKKFTISLSIVALLFLGGWYAKQLVVNKVGTEITKVITSPEVQKEITKLPSSQIDHMISTTLKTNPAGQSATKAAPSAAAAPHTSGAGTNQNENTPVSNNSGKDYASSKEQAEKPVANNRQEAIQFAMSRFSTKEIMHYMTVYQDRRNLTASQKKAIKAEILSRFTPEEIRELAAAAKK
jgi:hypothetical protein